MNKIFVALLVLAYMSATVGASFAETEVQEAGVKEAVPLGGAAQDSAKSMKEGKECTIEAWGRTGPVYPNGVSMYKRITYGTWCGARPLEVQITIEIPSPWNQKFSEGVDGGWVRQTFFDARLTPQVGSMNGALIDFRAK